MLLQGLHRPGKVLEFDLVLENSWNLKKVLFVLEIVLEFCKIILENMGAQRLSGRVLDSRPKGRRFEPHRRHCVVSLSKNINPSLVLVQPRKTRPFITERLLMGRKESNQTNKILENMH